MLTAVEVEVEVEVEVAGGAREAAAGVGAAATGTVVGVALDKGGPFGLATASIAFTTSSRTALLLLEADGPLVGG